MYVCVCQGVTEKHIAHAVRNGARRLRDLREQLGVTTECGRCAECAHQCLKGSLPAVLDKSDSWRVSAGSTHGAAAPELEAL